MDKNKKNVPKIRFPGFEEPWEKRKLGKLCDVYDGTHQTPDYKNSGVMFLSVENIKSLKSEKFISEEDFKKEFNIFPEKGDVLMTRIGDIGTANVVETSEPKAYYVSLALLKNKSLDPYFLKESIFSERVKNDIWRRTLHIAFPKKINKNEIAQVIIPYPVKKEEQEQIGTIFKKFNQLITLHQRKLEHLKDKKKGLLQKMFPKEGEKFPELRFPGFTKPWEQRKLGDVTETITKGTTPNDKSWCGPVNYIKTESIDKESGTITRTASTSIEEHEGLLQRSQMKENDILFSIVGTLGRVGLVKSKDLPANTNQQISIIRLNDAIPQYVLYALKSPSIKSFIDRETTIGAQPSLSLWQINKMEIPIPSILEQKKIGDYFQNFDNLITLHQRKLEHLQQQKKGLLQQMFI